MAGSHESSIFNFLKNCFSQLHQFTFPTAMHNGCLIFISSSAFVTLVFLIKAMLTGVRWYLIMALICIFLIASDAEHFFTCWLAIHIFFSVKCLFMFFAHFLIRLFVFTVQFYNFWMSALSDMFTNIFSYSVACLFILLTGSYATQKFLILMRSIYCFSLLCVTFLVSCLRNIH